MSENQTAADAKAKLIAYLEPWIVLDTRPEVDEPHGFDLIDAVESTARAEGRAEAQEEMERQAWLSEERRKEIVKLRDEVTRLSSLRRACACSTPDPVMQADGKFYCYRCSFQTGARPAGLEPESSRLAPQEKES